MAIVELYDGLLALLECCERCAEQLNGRFRCRVSAMKGEIKHPIFSRRDDFVELSASVKDARSDRYRVVDVHA